MGAGTFSAGAFTGFNLTQSGATPGRTGHGDRRTHRDEHLQHFQLDKPVTTGATGTVTATGTGNATAATGVGVASILRPVPAITGYPIKKKIAGSYVNYQLFLRYAAWHGLASFHRQTVPRSRRAPTRPSTWSPTCRSPTPPATDTGHGVGQDPVGLTPPVMGHYFTAFNVSIDNKDGATDATEYYRRHWLPPATPRAKHQLALSAAGSVTATRPARHAPGTGSWRTRTEIDAAIEGKIDGFFIDLLSMTSTNNHVLTTQRLYDAADAVYAETGKVFCLVPMIDGTAKPSASVFSGTTIDVTASANAIADHIASYRNRRSFWRHRTSGKFILPIYAPDQWPSTKTMGFAISNPTSDRVAFWTQVKARPSPTGTFRRPVVLLPEHLERSTTADRFNSIVTGTGAGATATQHRRREHRCKPARAVDLPRPPYSRKWMHFCRPWRHPTRRRVDVLPLLGEQGAR